MAIKGSLKVKLFTGNDLGSKDAYEIARMYRKVSNIAHNCDIYIGNMQLKMTICN